MDDELYKILYPLQLQDPESDKIYIVNLSEEDIQKVSEDYDFASSLLESAKRKELMEDNPELLESITEDIITHKDSQRHIWQPKEVERLIAAYDDHKEELHHPKRRKDFWNNVENDMLSSGFSVSAHMCQQKWKNLLRSYKIAKDNKNSSGRGACRFQFFNLMDEILGTTPSNQSAHTLSSLSTAVSQDNLDLPSTSSSCTFDDSFSSYSDKENNDEIINKKKRYRTNKSEIAKDLKRKRFDERIALEKEKLTIKKQKLAMEEEKIKLMKEYIAIKKQKDSHFFAK